MTETEFDLRSSVRTELNKVCLIVLFVCFEVSSSDDEETLSGMEKLVSCLEKLTELIMKSLKSTDTKESGIF